MGCFFFVLLYSFSTIASSILLTTCHAALRIATYASYHPFLPAYLSTCLSCPPTYLPTYASYQSYRSYRSYRSCHRWPTKKCPSVAASRENEGKKENGFGKLFFSLFPQTRTQHSPLIFYLFFYFFRCPLQHTHTLSVV